MAVLQTQRPLRETLWRPAAGELGDACLDLASDLRFAGGFVTDLGNERSERSDLAASLPQTHQIAGTYRGDRKDFRIGGCWTGRAFVTEQKCQRFLENPSLPGTLVTDGFKLKPLDF